MAHLRVVSLLFFMSNTKQALHSVGLWSLFNERIAMLSVVLGYESLTWCVWRPFTLTVTMDDIVSDYDTSFVEMEALTVDVSILKLRTAWNVKAHSITLDLFGKEIHLR